MSRITSVLSLVCVAAFFLPSSRAKDPDFVQKALTFKTVGKVKIQAELYRPGDTEVRPVVVWLHGGALIVGSRLSVPKNLLDLCRKQGYALVSFDYRLAPEVKLPEIIEDVKDAFRWLRTEARTLHIDPERLVVTGGSAGGYLTMMTGICVQPRPRALVAYWGYGDVDGEWYTRPSEFYRTSRPLVSKEAAYAAVGKQVLSGTEGAVHKDRGQFYLYCRQNGLWTKEVTGFDAARDRAKLDPFCPVRKITKDYPPILMIHGTKDTDVPYELSANMAKELARHKVPHELVTVVNGGHGLGGADPKHIADAHEKGLAFIRRHLQK